MLVFYLIWKILIKIKVYFRDYLKKFIIQSYGSFNSNNNFQWPNVDFGLIFVYKLLI